MRAVLLKDLKAGDYFTRKPLEYPKESQVLIKRDYDRSDKKYCCEHFDDMNRWVYLKGTTTVYVDFTF